jgi:hypothetical protein
MAKIVVGDPSTWKYPDGTYWGYLAKVQRISGDAARWGGLVRGFHKEGDSATYALDVVKAGDYAIQLEGTEVDGGAPLSIKVAGQTFAAKKVTEKKVDFGAVSLPVGEMELELVAGKPAGKTQPMKLERILFVPQK